MAVAIYVGPHSTRVDGEGGRARSGSSKPSAEFLDKKLLSSLLSSLHAYMSNGMTDRSTKRRNWWKGPSERRLGFSKGTKLGYSGDGRRTY